MSIDSIESVKNLEINGVCVGSKNLARRSVNICDARTFLSLMRENCPDKMFDLVPDYNDLIN